MTRRLSSAWRELEEAGLAPEIDGRSAEEARRDRQRKRPITPSERRRRKRKVGLTLSLELVAALRRVGKEMGYVDDEGEGVVCSRLAERFLRLAIEAYEQGLIERYEEQVVVAQQELRWKSAAGGGH